MKLSTVQQAALDAVTQGDFIAFHDGGGISYAAKAAAECPHCKRPTGVSFRHCTIIALLERGVIYVAALKPNTKLPTLVTINPKAGVKWDEALTHYAKADDVAGRLWGKGLSERTET